MLLTSSEFLTELQRMTEFIYLCLLEITELVEDFQDSTEKYVLQKHNIVRRAAHNDSVVSPSTSITFPSKHVLPRISFSSLEQPVSSPTILRLSSISKTVLPASKTMSFVTGRIPTTLPPITSKKPSNTTPKHTHATSKWTTPDRRETSPTSSRPSEYFKVSKKRDYSYMNMCFVMYIPKTITCLKCNDGLMY